MPQTITLMNAVYSDVPAVELPKAGGGFATFTDTSETTATASDVAAGKVFVDSAGVLTTGTGAVEDTLIEALHNPVTSVEDDTLTSIRSMGLAYMTALTSVSFPNLQTINTYAFYDDYNLIMNGWPFPKAKTISNYAFRYCYGLTGDIVLPSTVTHLPIS